MKHGKVVGFGRESINADSSSKLCGAAPTPAPAAHGADWPEGAASVN